MSFIGSLDQFDLSIILQRIESYKKTGLLLVKQGERAVELSFRQGQLLCIGPVRPDVSLAGRLLQAGIISQKAYQEAIFTLGAEQNREVSAALVLIDLGHVNQQNLYMWAFNEASHIIEALVAWPAGEIYFEENRQPPTDRLLIALPILSLLPEQHSESPAEPVSVGAVSTASNVQPQHSVYTSGVSEKNVADTPTMHGEEPVFFDNTTAVASLSSSLFAAPGTVPDTERNIDSLSKSLGTILPPQPVMTPPAPVRVNIASMQPQMVLAPVDLSAYREQNPQIPFTPEQWRLFSRADGQMTLQLAAQELSMSRDQVCQVAGELVALGVITLSQPSNGFGEVNELSPISREYIQAGLSNGIMTPGYAASPAQPFEAIQPTSNPHNRFSLPYPIETHSQWGNGGNGATFVLGNGWVVNPPSAQPTSSNPYEAHHTYAKAG